MRVWAFMADSCGELVIWCVGNLQHQRPTAMGRKSLIAWQGSAGAGGRGSRGGVPDGPLGYPARRRTLTRLCAPPSPVAQEGGSCTTLRETARGYVASSFRQVEAGAFTPIPFTDGKGVRYGPSFKALRHPRPPTHDKH